MFDRIRLFVGRFFSFNLLFLAALGLRCGVWAFSSCGKWGLLFIVVRGLLIVVAFLVAEQGSRRVDSVVAACGL